MQLSTKTNFLDCECAKLNRGNPKQVFHRPRQPQRKPQYLFPGDCSIRIPTLANEYNPIYRHITSQPHHRIRKFPHPKTCGKTLRPIPTQRTNGIPHTFRSLPTSQD